MRIEPKGGQILQESGFSSHANTGVMISLGNYRDAATGDPLGGIVHDQSGDPNELPMIDNSVRLFIRWQDGPLDRESGAVLNGVFVEDVLESVSRRLSFYQGGPFAHPANEEANEHIRKAIKALVGRREDRQIRGVEGKNAA